MKHNNILIREVPEKKGGGIKLTWRNNGLKRSNLRQETSIQIQEAQHIATRWDHGHNIIKISNIKERILKKNIKK